jgi:RNA polymerase sigma-70 factor (ECF subfamily)
MNASESDVHRLLRCARQGDASALGTLLEMYRQYLSLIARLQLDQTLLGKVSSSDIVQDTFLNAKRGFSEFRGQTERELITWLRRIMANRLVEAARFFNTQQRDAKLERAMEARVDQSSLAIGRWLIANSPSPSEQVSKREQAVLLANALGALPPDYREVLVLRHLEDLSFPDISTRMNRTLDSVKNVWARAIVKLRSELEARS